MPVNDYVASFFDPYMAEAIRLAEQGAAADEVPVGAVIVRDAELLRSAIDGGGDPNSRNPGAIIGRGHDRKIELADPTGEGLRAVRPELGEQEGRPRHRQSLRVHVENDSA